jgi:hypothetical protein
MQPRAAELVSNSYVVTPDSGPSGSLNLYYNTKKVYPCKDITQFLSIRPRASSTLSMHSIKLTL